ncbi:MAG TPA: hypothetical protein VKE51_37185 [Vicinamibacterales bacterium]|nr:hypothetical protein [Vicinamibacterales bacterium]
MRCRRNDDNSRRKVPNVGVNSSAQHDDLKFFRVSGSEQKRDELQDALEGNRKDGQEHGFSSKKSRYFTQIDLTHPLQLAVDGGAPGPQSAKPHVTAARR